MWVRRSAISAIAPFARVSDRAVQAICKRIASAEGVGLDWRQEGATRMASVQPALSAYLQSEAPLALQAQALEFGKELGVGVFLMFEAAHGGALETLTEQSIAASEAELRADEELRVAEPKDPLDSEDILAVEQAHLMAHLNTRLSETLAFHADAIDVDHVGQVYRSLVVAILALSKAVVAPRGYSPPREGESVD